MDLEYILKELRERRDQIKLAIQSLEGLGGVSTKAPREVHSPPKKSNRGRKSMSPEERAAVSERMRAYWASRRQDS
jgi:hypothetical protein